MDDIELRVANGARELLLDRVSIRDKRLVLPDPPAGSDAASALARACVQQAQESIQACLPLSRQIKLVTELVDRLGRYEGVLMLIRDPFNHGFSVGPERHIHYLRSSEARVSKFQLADDQETAEVVDRILPHIDAPGSHVLPEPEEPSPDAPQLSLDWLVHRSVLSREAAAFLERCVAAGLNIVVSGELGAGRTTTVAALAALAGRDERVITVEETPEFALPLDHVVGLALPPLDVQTRVRFRRAITMRDLMRQTARLRPDRILLGEVRGPEVYDLFDVLRSTQASALTSVSARSPHEAIARLEQLTQGAVPGMPLRDVLELVTSSVDVIVHQERLPDGLRQVTSIMQMHGLDGDQIDARLIFELDQGKLAPTGARPSFQRVRTPPVPRESAISQPPLAAVEGEDEAGPVFHWVGQVVPRTMNPLKERQLERAGLSNPGSTPETRERAEDLKLHLLLTARLPEVPEVTAAINAAGDWRAISRAKVAVRACLDLAIENFPATIPEERRTAVVEELCNEVIGAGRVQPLLDDPQVQIVMINGPGQIMVRSSAGVTRSSVTYESDAQLLALVDRFAPRPVFHEVDTLSPTKPLPKLDPIWLRTGTLPDGTAITAILPPATMIGPVVILRKPGA